MSLPRTLGESRPSKGYAASIANEAIAKQYAILVENEALLDSTEEIALVTSRLHQLLTKMEEGESRSLIQNVKNVRQDIRTANARKDIELMNEATQRMNALLYGRPDDYQIWEDIFRTIDIQKKLIDTETKRRVSMHKVMETDDAMAFVTKVLFAVKKHVAEPSMLRNIQVDIQEAMLEHPEVMRNMAGQGM